ncbi:PREDICTED: trophoblast glycoprotein-like [Nipponia nippon]|uniref:trophoblast glycoprotein-like n=1 Tax=Nipponia nippon TaxID=128390 RepID=UPI000511936B|nr:PREDICTED: trophoblast glycoprotein-like [Nipponia nippon]
MACRYERLEEPPKELPSTVHNLSIAGSNLSVLHRAAFAARPLPDLRLLRLRHDNIQIIEDMALQGLPALRTLDLSHNPLLSVAAGAFAGVPLLHTLQLNQALLAAPLEEQLALALRNISLRRLELAGNSLRALPAALLPGLACTAAEGGEPGQLETASYVFFGIVLALIGIVFLMVLYLNRRGIKRWLHNLREACRDQMEGYHYRYEQDADPRRTSAIGTPGL